MVVYSKYFYSTDHVGFMSESSAVSTTPAPGRESDEERRESQKTPSTGMHLLSQRSNTAVRITPLHFEMKDHSNITQKNEIKMCLTSNVTLLNTVLSLLFVFYLEMYRNHKEDYNER